MKYIVIVRCTARDCYLHQGVVFGDPAPAELLAFAHEQRHTDKPEAHVVTVTEDVTDSAASNTSGGNSGPEGRPL